MSVFYCHYTGEPWGYYVISPSHQMAKTMFHNWIKNDCFGKTDYEFKNVRGAVVRTKKWVGAEVITSKYDLEIGKIEMLAG